jgi:hypothetical protein
MSENKHSGRLKIPKRVGQDKVTAATIQQFFDRVADYQSSKRCELVEEWLKANAYVAGIQWFKVERNAVHGTGSGFRLPRLVDNSREDIPQPTRALTLKLHDAEVSQLSKRHSEMSVEPADASNPGSRAAAKTATNILKHHIKTIKFPHLHRKFWDQNVRYGNGVLLSWLLWDHQDTVKVPVTTALKCAGSKGVETKQRPAVDPLTGGEALDPLTGAPMMEDYEEPFEKPSCGSWLSDRKASAKDVEKVGGHSTAFMPENVGIFGQPPTSYSAVACPCCMGDLTETTPTFAEAKEQDYLGRPLGKDQPLAKAVVDVPSLYGWLPENEGVGVEPWTIHQHAFLFAWPMSFVERYFPQNAHLVEPDSAETIAEVFPLMGEYDRGSRGVRGTNDRNLYHDHVLGKMFFSDEKTKEHPKGRFLIMAGKVVLADDDYWIPGEEDGEDLGRVSVGIGRCFIRDGEVWADGFPRMTRSANRAINMTAAQIIDRREHSFSNIIATVNMGLVKEWTKKLAGYILRWKPDPHAPGSKPEVVQTPLTDTSGLNEIKYHEEAAEGDVGLHEADTGELKGLASTPYSMYHLSKQSSGERRQPRINEGVEAIQQVLKHQLQLIQRFYREPRQYKVKVADGWEVKEFQGADIAGETDVKVKEEPFFDQKNATRDATAKEVETGHLVLTTKRAQREYFKTVGVAESVLDESNVQLDRAQRNWMEWYRRGKEPQIDVTKDDLDLHHQELGRLLFTDDGVERAIETNWDEIVGVISEWDSAALKPIWEVEVEKVLAIIPQLKKVGWKAGQPIFREEPQTQLDPATGMQLPVIDPNTGQPVMHTVNLFDSAAQLAHQEAVQSMQAMAQQTQMQAESQSMAAGMPAPVQVPPTPPPQPPPSENVNPEPLKPTMQAVIKWVWNDLCMRAGVDTSDEKRQSFMAISAVCEAYRLLSVAKSGVMPLEPGATPQAPGAVM